MADEAPIEAGTLVRLVPAEGLVCTLCECPRTCSFPIWEGDPVVRNLRGKMIRVVCAVNLKLTTWEELKDAYAVLLAEDKHAE